MKMKMILYHQDILPFNDECPTGLCLESKPTCTRNGGKVIQVKPRDPKSDDEKMRCCGVQKCKMPRKKENTVVLLGYV